MNSTKERAYQTVAQLTERFDQQIDIYKKDYNEHRVHIDFIDPFFNALDNSNQQEKKAHDNIIRLVNTILILNQQLQQTTLPQQQEQLKQRIAFTDKKVDALVYELYGLNEEEIKIVKEEIIKY